MVVEEKKWKRNGEVCVSNEYVFVCECNGKMVERFDVFVISLFY